MDLEDDVGAHFEERVDSDVEANEDVGTDGDNGEHERGENLAMIQMSREQAVRRPNDLPQAGEQCDADADVGADADVESDANGGEDVLQRV